LSKIHVTFFVFFCSFFVRPKKEPKKGRRFRFANAPFKYKRLACFDFWVLDGLREFLEKATVLRLAARA
jgi:hypothetical protein